MAPALVGATVSVATVVELTAATVRAGFMVGMCEIARVLVAAEKRSLTRPDYIIFILRTFVIRYLAYNILIYLIYLIKSKFTANDIKAFVSYKTPFNILGPNCNTKFI